jgi:hypothetical protein
MTVAIPSCTTCRHFRETAKDGSYCDAFPLFPGIPDEIILGEHDHKAPFPGDHGIQFEPEDEEV